MTIYNKLKEAINNQKSVTITCGGHQRKVSPHCLGTGKSGSQKVLTYQYDGYSSQGLPPNGAWRCFEVNDISIVEINTDSWQTQNNQSKPQTCVTNIEFEVK